jgi:hypothetical protein
LKPPRQAWFLTLPRLTPLWLTLTLTLTLLGLMLTLLWLTLTLLWLMPSRARPRPARKAARFRPMRCLRLPKARRTADQGHRSGRISRE